MSGKAKRTIYYAAEFALFLAATAGAVLLCLFFARSDLDYVLLPFVFLAESLRLPVLVHELGHLLCGLAAGLRPVSFSLGFLTVGKGGVRFSLSDAAGATAMLPRGERNVRGRLAFFTAGGALLNFVLGGALLALFFALPLHSALLFFAEFALFLLYEGGRALLPAELPAGKTDGAFLLGLLKKTADAEVALRVMTAQGLLYTKHYAELPRGLLFEAPVVREDSAAYLALLQLQWRYLFCAGDADFRRPLLRLGELADYLAGEDRAEALSDLVYAKAALWGEGEEARGLFGELTGRGAAVLRAEAALEPTEENVSRAEKAAAKERMAGVRAFECELLARLKK